tara:strand:+ start:220 stop:372 length:153 start_codon:yes stop_codon:yes gene_type:complete
MVSEGLELWVWLSSREQSEKQRLVCLVNRQEAMLIQIMPMQLRNMLRSFC